MVQKEAKRDHGVCEGKPPGGVCGLPRQSEPAGTGAYEALRDYAAASDRDPERRTNARRRVYGDITTASFLLATAIAEAVVFLEAGAIDELALRGAAASGTAFSSAIGTILEDKELARKMEIISQAVSVGIEAVVKECSALCRGANVTN